MAWSFSFQLMPGEEVIEDSTSHQKPEIKSAYSVFLTNQRVIFRFDGLGSTLTQSFPYHEILDAKPATRLLISYLCVKTVKKDFYLNVSDADYWAEKIIGVKESMKNVPAAKPSVRPISPEMKRRELHDMLAALKKNSLLTDSEFEEKVRMLDSQRF